MGQNTVPAARAVADVRGPYLRNKKTSFEVAMRVAKVVVAWDVTRVWINLACASASLLQLVPMLKR